MGRVPRINIKGALYYVTSRGDHEQDIFKSDPDYLAYFELLKKYKEQYGFKLFSFILLPNHLHLLIELTGDATISQIMHALNSNYTKYFNGKYDRKGHLFQERYKMVIAEKAPYLGSITSYIHEHPIRLGLAKTQWEYKYTSYKNYQGDKSAPIDINIEEGIKDISEEEYSALSKELGKNGIIGSAEFIESANAKLELEKSKALEAPNRILVRDSRNRKIMIVGGSILVALGLVSSFLYIRAAVVKQKLDEQVAQEKVRIRNLDERYRADRVSYEAVAKQLELERKRASEFEKNLKTTAQESAGPVAGR